MKTVLAFAVALLFTSCSGSGDPEPTPRLSPRENVLPLGYWRLFQGSVEGREKTLDYPSPSFPVDAVARVEKEFIVVAVKAVGTSPSRDTVLCTTLGQEMPITYDDQKSLIVYKNDNTYCKGYDVLLTSVSNDRFTIDVDPESGDLQDWAFRHWETYARSTEEEFNRLRAEWRRR